MFAVLERLDFGCNYFASKLILSPFSFIVSLEFDI